MGPITILMYHSLDTGGSVVSVPPAVFGDHMARIAALGYRGMSLRDALSQRDTTGAWPARAVVLTFDDGYANFHDCALPALQAHGFSATVFVVTRHVGRLNDWATTPPRLGPQPMLSWQQLLALSSCGIEIGAHTRSHPDLSHLSAQQLEHEIAGSRADIEDRLGQPVSSFAYPFGLLTPNVVAVAGRHFRAACTTTLKRASGESPHQLPRVDAYYIARTPDRLEATITGRLDRYLALRRCGRAIRALAGRTAPIAHGSGNAETA